jgi:hypothetical protein
LPAFTTLKNQGQQVAKMAIFEGLGGWDRTGTRFVSSEEFYSHPFGCKNKKGVPFAH